MRNAPDKYRAPIYRYQPIDQKENITNKQRIFNIMQQIINASLVELEEAIRDGFHIDANISVTHPINELSNLEMFADKVWKPLRHAIPDVERRDEILAGGIYQESYCIGCLGHYVGTFVNDWLGIPASRQVVAVRYAEGHELRDGKIIKSYVFIDFLDLMRQIGYWPIAPSLGREMRWLPPATYDGVILTPQDNAISQRSIERVLNMHAALGLYNGRPPSREVLDQMQMVRQRWTR